MIARALRSDVATMSRGEACARLGIGRRRLRELVHDGILAETGEGHSRRVLAASVEGELSRRKEKWQSVQEKAAIGGEPDKGLPNFSKGHLGAETFSGDPVTGETEMVLRFPGADPLQSTELVSVARAAAAANVSERLMHELVERNEIPSVQVGSRRRINVEVLRRWSRGELARQGR